MDDLSDVSELIHLIYETVDDPGTAAWEHLLKRLFAHVHAHMGSVFYIANGETRPVLMGAGERAQRDYVEYFNQVDPWLEISRSYTVQNGEALEASHLLVPDKIFHSTEYFHDFARKVDFGYGFGYAIAVNSQSKLIVNAAREAPAGPFTEAELQQLRILGPHLRQAVRLNKLFRELDTQRSFLLERLDEYDEAVLFTDGDARIIVCNESARAAADLDDGLSIREGHLFARSPGETNSLHRLIKGAVNKNEPGGMIPVTRPSGKTPWMVNVVPYRFDVLKKAACVLVKDPEKRVVPDAEALSRLYGLTPAETRFAMLFAAGDGIDQTAEKLGITVNTARTHAKRVFGKTSTRGQAELAALLSRLPHTRRNF